MTTLTPEEATYYLERPDDDQRPNELASIVCGLFAAVVAVGARIAARRISRARLGPEDWAIFAAMAGEITYAVVFSRAVDNGQGRHIVFIKDMVGFSQGFVIAIVSYSYTVMFTKISILIFYCRLFRLRWMVICSWVVAAIVIMYNMTVILIAGLQCIPLSDLWTGGPSCINTEPSFTGLAVVNIITDVAILALPIKPVLSLNMKTSRKVQVLGIFLLGGVVCVFGIIRAVAMTQLSLIDPTWTTVGAAIWSFVEISVGIVAACLPLLAPLIRARRSVSRVNTSGRRFNSGGSGNSSVPRAKRGWQLRTSRLSPTASMQGDNILLTGVSERMELESELERSGYQSFQIVAGSGLDGSASTAARASSEQNENRVFVQNEIKHTVTFC